MCLRWPPPVSNPGSIRLLTLFLRVAHPPLAPPRVFRLTICSDNPWTFCSTAVCISIQRQHVRASDPISAQDTSQELL